MTSPPRPAAPATPPEPAEPSSSDAGKPEEGPSSFTFYDVFFWRDAPDWYRKTFLSAGFGLCYCTVKQILNIHELEVFMPPRSKILPQTMQDGYRNSQRLKYGFLKVGGEVTTIAGAAAAYYAGAYYLGHYRGVHSWENFACSGAASGVGVALWLMRPIKARPVAFGVLLGGLLGGAAASIQQVAGVPFWDESHQFQGWFLGSRINMKKTASDPAASDSGRQPDPTASPASPEASPVTASPGQGARALGSTDQAQLQEQQPREESRRSLFFWRKAG